jgi:hypothetical protein
MFTITFRSSNRNVQKHPEAKAFRNRGWEHYQEMSAILPARTSGQLAFSAQMRDPVSAGDISSGSPSDKSSLHGGHDDTPDLNQDGGGGHDDAPDHNQDGSQLHDPMHIDMDTPNVDDMQLDDNDGTMQPDNSAFRTSSTDNLSATPSIRTTHSIRAARLSASASPISVSNRSSSNKALKMSRITAPQAISGVADRLGDLNTTMRMELTAKQRSADAKQKSAEAKQMNADTRRLAADVQIRLAEAKLARLGGPTMTPREEKLEAVKLLTQLESTSLQPEAFLAMVDLFNTDADQAGIYLAMDNEIMRRAWIQRQLAKVNFTVSSSSS